jgi:hypothetical protein
MALFHSKQLAGTLLALTLGLCAGAVNATGSLPSSVTLSKDVLQDKIKGAWAAQTIAVSYGIPVEFAYSSSIIPDSHTLPWYDGRMKALYTSVPGVYDDVYMDLTFVQVLEDEGMDAPAQSFADAYAKAGYPLWFANQVGRHNILAGLKPPASGHWLNNPAADDIDFQIEADFAGIMNPGMVNSAVAISDTVGHIMNYGDGWYGGVFVASMYSLAYISDDIPFIINEALKTIPAESHYHQVISDVILAHKTHPKDWKAAWFDIHRRWGAEDHSPDGVFDAFNIDAKINSAWVVLGLLYGEGDFTRTIEIAMRGGDDADCNPSTAAGILGAIYGYDAIPAHWKQGLAEVEPIDFANTSISLNDAYKLSFKHALEMIERGGGSIDDNTVTIAVQKPVTTPLEQSFVNHYPVEKRPLSIPNVMTAVLTDTITTFTTDFEGVGFVLTGKAEKLGKEDVVLKARVLVDGKEMETTTWPTDMITRRIHLTWKFELPQGKHKVEVQLLNPTDKAMVNLHSLVVYADKPRAASY